VIYLHARTQNWNARFAAYISVAGFISVICTFLGVGYVLPFMETYLGVSTGLHSYAGGDAVAGTVFFCGILGAVLLLLFVTRRRPPSADAAPSAHAAVNGS
jgi:ABC-type transport system involved in cytochrome c biogenesis permease subunit